MQYRSETTEPKIKVGGEVDLTNATRVSWCFRLADTSELVYVPAWLLPDNTLFIHMANQHAVELFKRTELGRRVLAENNDFQGT